MEGEVIKKEESGGARKKALLTFGIAILLIVGLWIIASSITKYTGYAIQENFDDFAKCLSEKTILYVSETCPHCANQKAMFKDSIKYLNLVECSVEKELCLEKNLEGVPAWEINGEIYYGVQDFEILSDITDCEVN